MTHVLLLQHRGLQDIHSLSPSLHSLLVSIIFIANLFSSPPSAFVTCLYLILLIMVSIQFQQKRNDWCSVGGKMKVNVLMLWFSFHLSLFLQAAHLSARIKVEESSLLVCRMGKWYM